MTRTINFDEVKEGTYFRVNGELYFKISDGVYVEAYAMKFAYNKQKVSDEIYKGTYVEIMKYNN